MICNKRIKSLRKRTSSQLRKWFSKQLLNVVHKPTFEDFVVEQIRSLSIFNTNFLVGANYEEILTSRLGMDSLEINHFTYETTVRGFLVGAEVNSKIVEIFLIFAVFEQVFLDFEYGPVKDDHHDLPLEMNDGEIDGGSEKQVEFLDTRASHGIASPFSVVAL